MEIQQLKIWVAVIITAIVVGGGVYYFRAERESEINNQRQGNMVFDQSSKEYAVMGRRVWSAFECGAWASTIKDEKESERLFAFGYEQGQKFLGAMKAAKVKQEDISQEVPIGVTMILQGPTDEFILGRIFETAQKEALDEVFKTDNEFNSDEIQEIIAGNKFRDGNCQLIGK